MSPSTKNLMAVGWEKAVTLPIDLRVERIATEESVGIGLNPLSFIFVGSEDLPK